MSVITKDLGVATAYGYAKSKGYTGTEEEFAELMASYADVAQQAEAAAQDAEDAKDAAVSAKNDAQTAQAAAESAQTAAAGSAQTASTKASEASNSAQTAAGSATAAGNSATAASGSASTAQTAAQTATNKASEASSSASAASTAKTGAETARTGAQSAQTAAETAQANAEAAAASVSASAAQIEQNTEDITGLKNDLTQGTFPVGNAENAEQLTSTVGIEDTAPYLFRTSGGSNDIGDREDVRKIVGVSIPWNQLIPTANKSGSNTGTDTRALNLRVQGDSNNTIIASQILSTGTFNAIVNMGFTASNAVIKHSGAVRDIPFVYNMSVVASHKYMVSLYFSGVDLSTEGGMSYDNFMLTDITLAFGTAIADYVYSIETATAGAGVAWLKKNFPKQFDAGYQAYDAGSMQSVSGLTAHKMVGFNQWDEELEVGNINATTGQNEAGSVIRSKNYIPVLPNTVYYANVGTGTVSNFVWFEYDADKNYLGQQKVVNDGHGVFTTSANAHYIRFRLTSGYGTTYNHDICINLHWDGEKDGTYEPYKTWSYALDDTVVIRGIPKVDANGNLYYDGDEYLPDGTINRRYGIVDLGTLNWAYDGTRFLVLLSDAVSLENKPQPNAISSKYVAVRIYSDGSSGNFFISNSQYLSIWDSSYTNAATFKAAMSGVMLVYELATPTTETADPYQTPQIVDDFGTEEFVLADGAFPVPVGHNTMYQNNLRAKLEMSPDSPDGDGLYVVQQESGENTYVPLASTATIQDILTRLTALENA